MRKIVLLVAAVALLGACARSVPEAENPSAGPIAAPRLPPQSTPDTENWRNPDPRPDRRITTIYRYSAPEPRPPTATYSSYGGVPAEVPSAADYDVRRPGDRPPGRDIVDLLGNEPKAGPEPRSKPKIDPETPETAVNYSPAPPRRPVSATPAPPVRPTVMVSTAPEAVPAAPVPEVANPVPSAPAPVIAYAATPSLAAPGATLDTTPTLPPMVAYGKTFSTSITRGSVPSSLGVANIKSEEAAKVAVDGLEQSSADDSGAIPWSEAVALLQAGEIESYVGVGGQDILVTLCSGRGVLTTMPSEGAILAIAPPGIICGREAALQGQ